MHPLIKIICYITNKIQNTEKINKIIKEGSNTRLAKHIEKECKKLHLHIKSLISLALNAEKKILNMLIYREEFSEESNKHTKFEILRK